MVRLAKRWLLALLAPAVLLAVVPAAASATEVEDKCGSAPNPIVCENALPGDPASEWQLEKVGDPTIQGFATSMSVNVGETESFKINTPASAYHIEILRLGYYGGDGARVVNTEVKPTAQLPQAQPECLKEVGTGLIDCGNWGVSAHWTVPSNAVSGVYMALLTRTDTGGQSQILFVVRNDASHSKILLQTSDATWEAYNDYGGNSLYSCTVDCPAGNPKSYKGAAAVSYNRPFDGALLTDNGASYLYYAEYQMMRFLEENGYEVTYTTSGEVDRNGALLKNHKVFMSSGHDEYWSAGQRASVEAAREAGVNLAFFSANEIFWKTRWSPSIDGSETPYRTLTSYKETHFEGPVDPKDPSTWTGAWRDPRGGPQDDGGKPENALSGQQFEVNSGTGEITVPSQYSKLRLWHGTAVAALQPGQTLTLAPDVGTLGYEWDEDVDNGFRPAGEFDLSSTTMSGVQAFVDYGSTLTNSATATHHLTLYRAPSGALVFGAGTVQWSWGLDNTNAWAVGSTDPEHPPVDRNMQQFTVNLLAEMGAQPGSLASGLVAVSPSTDTTPPTSTITSPTAGETLPDGSQVTIAGVASDGGGGVVAGVEVSTDNGASWHPATLTTPAEQTVAWSYSWATHGYPATTIKSRAVDDSSNLETPSAGVHVNVSCPCSIWGQASTPPTPDSGDTHSVEVGVKFSSETFGLITGLRFYKSAANTGTHIGNLWSASGQKLETATFSGESASGWQQVTFNKPVDIFPGTTYVASYFAPAGHYAASADYFYTPTATGGNLLNSPPLHALPAGGPAVNGVFASSNGLYSYGSSSTFPTNSFAGTNYWVDPVFTPVTAPGQVTNVSALAGNRSATLSWSAPTSGGPVTSYTITPYIGSEAQTPSTVTGTPPATGTTVTGLTGGTTYTFTVTASNPIGSGAASSPSSAVTPAVLSVASAPTAVTASAATSQAQLSWTAPSNNGGSPISSYTVTPYIGTSAQTAIEVPSSATSTIVKNLVNGTSYTFAIAANNAVGAGAAGTSSAVVPQDTVFDFSSPALTDSGDASASEVGVKFSSTLAGTVTGVRFYKAATNTGTHIGSLWSASGAKLAEATFTTETASGWQQVNFATPVAIAANTTYVAAYLAPKGHYSATSSAFASAGFSNPPLAALANSVSANGVYLYTSKSSFPTNTYKSTNYWVDVDFEPTPVPSEPTSVHAIAGPGSATVTWSAPSGGGPVTSYTVTPYIGSQAQPATVVSGSPPPAGATVTGLTDGTNYTFTVQASNSNGAGGVSAPSNTINPSALAAPGAPTTVTATTATSQAQVSWSEPASNGGSPITSYTVTPYLGSSAKQSVEVPASATTAVVKGLSNGSAYTFTVTASNAVGAGPESAASSAVTPQDTIFDFATPATIDSADPTSTEVGVKFTAESYGAVTGIRFYKAQANTGTHIGSLWSSSGQKLESVTFSAESASGWQQATFAQPVYVTAGSTYVAAYLAPVGHYSDTTSAFALSGVSNGPLSTLSNTVSANGVFAHSTTSTFPTSSGGGTNYWVDVDFEPAAIPGQVTNVNATAGRGSATLSWSAPSNGGPVTTYTITPYIGSEAQSPTTITGTPPATGTTISGLTNGSSYTFTVRASNPNGEGAASEHSSAIVPANTPSAPTAVTATAANASATVSWSEPSNGGSPITSYTITPYIGSEAQASTKISGTPPATATTITGLTNGASYTFTVTASNAVGAGAASEHSSAVVPLTVPSAPTAVTAVAGNASAKVSWTAPGNGGSPLTSYTITPYIGSEARSPTTITGNPPATTATVTGLTNGTAYTFTVSASSSVGTSPASSTSNAVTPNMAPGAPSAVSATAGNTSASVAWTAPENGGSPITSYTITPYVGASAQTATTISGTPPATATTITGLTNGTSYTFTVTASNAAGPGPASEHSNSVTPVSITAPSSPTAVTAITATSQAQVSWVAPSSNGGSAITSYLITPYLGSSAQPSSEVSGSTTTTAIVKALTNGSSYTFTVTAVNAVGPSAASPASGAVVPRNTIFDFATPATINSNDAHSTELGVKFTSEVAGRITGIRFYKSSANTGTHVATLWSLIGTKLGEATFSSESASGWQQANFSTPIVISPNTTYVAAYLAPKGDYSDSSSQFASASVTNPPLTALGNPLSANGVYSYSTTSVFPTSTYKATNYWVDVDFEPEL